MRTCKDCGKRKRDTNFTIRKNPNNSESVYFCSYCKPCMSLRTKKYNETHKESVNAYINEWKREDYKRNPEKYREYYRKKYYKNVKLSRAAARARYHARKARASK